MAEPLATGTALSALSQAIDGLKIEGKCYLTTIVPEIRNYIYELAFTPDPDTNFFTAKPPSKALCITNHKIYKETKIMYRSMYRDFWTKTEFKLDFRGLEDEAGVLDARKHLREALDAMSEEEVAHIQTMRTWTTGYQDMPTEWILKESGVWNEVDMYPELKQYVRDWFFFDPAHKNALKKAGFNLFVPIGMKSYWCAADFNIKDLPRVKQLACKDSPTKDELIAVGRMLTRYIIEDEDNDDFTQEEVGLTDEAWARWQRMKKSFGF